MQPILRSDSPYVTFRPLSMSGGKQRFGYEWSGRRSVAQPRGLPREPGSCQWWLSGWARPLSRCSQDCAVTSAVVCADWPLAEVVQALVVHSQEEAIRKLRHAARPLPSGIARRTPMTLVQAMLV